MGSKMRTDSVGAQIITIEWVPESVLTKAPLLKMYFSH